MKEVNGKVYAFVFDGATISQIELDNKNKVTQISADVTSFATSRDKTCYSENAQKTLDQSLDGYLFYSRSRNEQEGKNEGVGGNINVSGTDIGSKTGTSTYDSKALKYYNVPDSASADN